MLQNSPHIIQKQHLKVVFKDRGEDTSLPNELVSFYKVQLLPAFEQVLEETDLPDKQIQIDRLLIDVGVVPAADWKNELTRKAADQLKEEIKKTFGFLSNPGDNPTSEEIGVQVISREKGYFEAFLSFLESGTLSDPIITKPSLDWKKNLSKPQKWNTTDKKRLKSLLWQDQTGLKRFFWQLPKKFIEDILIQLDGAKIPDVLLSHPNTTENQKKIIRGCISLLLSEMQKKKHSEQYPSNALSMEDSAPALLLKVTLNEENALGYLKALKERVSEPINVVLQEYLNFKENGKNQSLREKGSNRGEALSSSKSKKTGDKLNRKEKKEMPQAYFINNAGLVIVHPWLLSFLKNLNLLDKDLNWKSSQAQRRALLLSQYMVTGEEETPEFDLMLNKILCNYSFNEPVESEIALREEEKEEAEVLLKTIITHWKKLKNTGIGGLQEGFLQREGKLSRDEQGWLLQVEQQTIDILMDALPWSISYIQNEIMEEPLRVEWI